MRDTPPSRRALTPTPEWLLNVVVRFIGQQDPKLVCEECKEILCTVGQSTSLWFLADVAHDHRTFCRGSQERFA